MEHGKNAEALEAMYDAGRHVPAIENRPSLTGWGWLWEAFWILGTCRQIGMSAGNIPWTAIQRYAEVLQMSPDETTMLHQVVRHLDSQLLAHFRSSAETKKTTRTIRRSPPRGAPRG